MMRRMGRIGTERGGESCSGGLWRGRCGGLGRVLFFYIVLLASVTIR